MVACKNGVAVVGNDDRILVKGCLTTGVTKLADRQQRAMREARKDMGLAYLSWDLR